LYLFLVDLRVLNEKRYHFFERLLPELNARNLIGEIKEVESNAAAVQAITDVLRRERYQTIVAVGDDAFLACVAGAALGTKVAIGYIPFGIYSKFGSCLHLPSTPGSVGTALSSRRLKEMDLLRMGRWYAAGGLTLEAGEPAGNTSRSHGVFNKISRYFARPDFFDITVEMDHSSLQLQCSEMAVLNGQCAGSRSYQNSSIDPGDGKMDVVMLPQAGYGERRRLWRRFENNETTTATHLRLKQCRLTVKGLERIRIDGHEVNIGEQFEVRVVEKAFRLIV
jgi:diacylglycerol kinase family enzyme